MNFAEESGNHRFFRGTAGKLPFKRSDEFIADLPEPFRSRHYRRKGVLSMELRSQKLREIAPELDPLRLGTGWKPEDLSKPQILVESSFGDSHPGSGHLLELVEEARKGIAEAGGYGARYFCTDICDGEAQGHGRNQLFPAFQRYDGEYDRNPRQRHAF